VYPVELYTVRSFSVFAYCNFILFGPVRSLPLKKKINWSGLVRLQFKFGLVRSGLDFFYFIGPVRSWSLIKCIGPFQSKKKKKRTVQSSSIRLEYWRKNEGLHGGDSGGDRDNATMVH
jgi:hypothetical protein